MTAGVRRTLLRFAFRLLYNEFAFTYDAVSWLVSRGRWASWQRAALPFLRDCKDGAILELAHGTGSLQVDLLREEYQSVALDLSANMGRLAARKLARHALAADIVRGDALALPFPNGAFTAIASTFPTSFIFEDAALSEMRRVLDTNGKVIIVLVGRLCGRGAYQGFIRFLYRITGLGYRPPNTSLYLGKFMEYGFLAETVAVPCEGSVADLLILKRQ